MRAPKAKPKRFKVVSKPRVMGDKYHRILDAAVSVSTGKGFHVARIAEVADSVADIIQLGLEG